MAHNFSYILVHCRTLQISDSFEIFQAVYFLVFSAVPTHAVGQYGILISSQHMDMFQTLEFGQQVWRLVGGLMVVFLSTSISDIQFDA